MKNGVDGVASHARHTARTVLWMAGTAVLVGVCSVNSALALFGPPWAFDGAPAGQDAVMTDLGALTFLAGSLSAFTLFFRRRLPWLPVVAGLATSVLLQLDGLLALLGAAALLGRRRGWPATAWTAAACTAAMWAGVRDGLRPENHSAVGYMFDMGGETGAQPGQVIVATVIAAVGVGAALFYGLIRRARREVEAADRRTRGEKSRSRELSTVVARKEERETIAQEVHDTLAHRLSLISLQSQGLGMKAGTTSPDIADDAEILRNHAHESLEDLRNLIGVLRTPLDEQQTAAAGDQAPLPHHIGLSDLDDLLDTSRQAGMQINSVIELTDIAGIDLMLEKAAYRVVQEALTNGRKHSPASPVWLWVRAAAGRGVLIRIVNRLSKPGPLDDAGSGTGVIGMRERIDALGGTASIGPDGQGNFLVDIELPWIGEVERNDRRLAMK